MHDILKRFDLGDVNPGAGTGGKWLTCTGEVLASVSPVDGSVLGEVRQASSSDYEQVATPARQAFIEWRMKPAPARGEIVRQIGNALRIHKKDLAELLSLEMGKIRAEAEGEIQEMIDICDFAVGQSRMLYGLSMHSERSCHRMYEQWHPLGPIGVITSFNFPVAVWAWNAMIALVAGDTVIWKPSSKVFLIAIAVMRIIEQVLKDNDLPEGILNIVIGNRNEIGDLLIKDRRLPLVSATGSVAMGRHVGQVVASRMGRTILELGGNNAVIITPDADMDLAVRAIIFGAVGTAGQRCTTIRRIIAHKNVLSPLKAALIQAYRQVVIGNPLEKDVLMGPLVDRDAVKTMRSALKKLKRIGGKVLYGGDILSGGLYDAGTYVTPCICDAKPDYPIIQEETFAPILYMIPYEDIKDAITYNNHVPQGLSSAIFTNNIQESELFLSHMGSDCGIANVNIGTSGAEIGGAFGGEKDTGGGRESGSDAWKAYMRRQTNTINWSGDMPLAQGIRFDTGTH